MDYSINYFHTNGFAVIPQAISTDQLDRMYQLAQQSIDNPTQPFELESDTGYPGAPSPNDEASKKTSRRLLQAYSRHELWQQWAHDPILLTVIRRVLSSDDISLTRCHHNCLMTKFPNWSSQTGWHQDIRYWSFEQPNLVNAWLSLTEETTSNGCLWVVPGSHKTKFKKNQLDQQQFFRDDLAENLPILKQAVPLESKPGDLLLFDARLLHCAAQNHSSEVKLSLVFTYKHTSNKPLIDTRSSSLPEIDMSALIKTHSFSVNSAVDATEKLRINEGNPEALV